jgi:hypothetical protein
MLKRVENDVNRIFNFIVQLCPKSLTSDVVYVKQKII